MLLSSTDRSPPIDGHRGYKWEPVNEKNVMGFRLVLSALHESEREFALIIHAKATLRSLSTVLAPEAFLARLGYQYEKACPVLEDKCFWLQLAELRGGPFFDDDRVQRIHDVFEAHADKLPQAYEAYKQIASLMRVVEADQLDLFPELRQFKPLVLTPSPESLPKWVVDELPPEYATAMTELRRVSTEIHNLRSIAGLLWATGEDLETAVQDAFRAMGYQAELTAPGVTYDVNVDIGSGKRFLVEATGIGGMLKKDTPKIGQVLQTLQQEVTGPIDRVLVAANPHRDTALKQRVKLEPVSPEAEGLLKGLGVAVIETAHLYEIWRRYLTDPAMARTQVDNLHAAAGGLFPRT